MQLLRLLLLPPATGDGAAAARLPAVMIQLLLLTAAYAAPNAVLLLPLRLPSETAAEPIGILHLLLLLLLLRLQW